MEHIWLYRYTDCEDTIGIVVGGRKQLDISIDEEGDPHSCEVLRLTKQERNTFVMSFMINKNPDYKKGSDETTREHPTGAWLGETLSRLVLDADEDELKKRWEPLYKEGEGYYNNHLEHPPHVK